MAFIPATLNYGVAVIKLFGAAVLFSLLQLLLLLVLLLWLILFVPFDNMCGPGGRGPHVVVGAHWRFSRGAGVFGSMLNSCSAVVAALRCCDIQSYANA